MHCFTAVEITSSPEKLKKYEGDTVQLVCEFIGADFNLFDNPVVWHKMQHLRHHGGDGDGDVYNESSQINMMGSVLKPFSETKRFKPTFFSSPPTYRFALTITGSRRDIPAKLALLLYCHDNLQKTIFNERTITKYRNKRYTALCSQ